MKVRQKPEFNYSPPLYPSTTRSYTDDAKVALACRSGVAVVKISTGVRRSLLLFYYFSRWTDSGTLRLKEDYPSMNKSESSITGQDNCFASHDMAEVETYVTALLFWIVERLSLWYSFRPTDRLGRKYFLVHLKTQDGGTLEIDDDRGLIHRNGKQGSWNEWLFIYSLLRWLRSKSRLLIYCTAYFLFFSWVVFLLPLYLIWKQYTIQSMIVMSAHGAFSLSRCRLSLLVHALEAT